MTVGELVKNRGSWHKSCHVKFNKEKLERAARKRDREDATKSNNSGKKQPRRQSLHRMACLFCDQEDGQLHEFITLGTDESIRQMATELQETELMARMEGSDLIVLEAKYHLHCLTVLRNRHRSLLRKEEQEGGAPSEEEKMKARAFVELVTYIENCLEEGVFCLKIFSLASFV